MTEPVLLDFVVQAWNAWAPEQSCYEHGGLVVSQIDTALIGAIVPKLMQRRLSPLAKGVFTAAQYCIAADKTSPIVFSSAHGEVNKALQMLKEIQNGDELSPTAFSLSVHNAISGLISIAYRKHQEIMVIAPGQDGIAPAFIEALGILQEYADSVVIVFYDEPLGDFYPSLPFALSAANSCALAIKIALHGDGLPLQLCSSPDVRDDGEHAVQIVAFLNFLAAEEQFIQLGNHRHSWIWRKK